MITINYRKWLGSWKARGIAGFLLAILGLIVVAACTSSSQGAGVRAENNVSNTIQDHYNEVQPLLQPTGKSEYRQVLTFVEASRILGLNTYTFFLRKGGQGGPMFECPSLGTAVPNTAELSNPEQIVRTPNSGNDPAWLTLPNMDPDGVHPPPDSAGTNVECVFRNGKPYMVMSEPDVLQINVSSAHWDASAYGGQGGIVITGAPQMPVCQVRTTQVSVTDSNGNTSNQPQQVTNCKKPKK